VLFLSSICLLRGNVVGGVNTNKVKILLQSTNFGKYID
jgi:hypothetical protein